MRHDVASSAKSAYGHAAADYFAECGEVGRDVVMTLCTVQAYAEASHDFIKN